MTLVAVSTSLGAWPVWAGCAAVLAGVAVAARVSAVALWRRARFVLPVALVAVFVPFARSGGQEYDLGPLVAHEEGLRTFV